jgi:hypothetical protein
MSDARCHELEDEVNSLRAQLNRWLDPTEESNTDSKPDGAGPMYPLVNDFSPLPATSELPENLNITNFTTEWKRGGTDWSIALNPYVEHVLNIALIRTFNHER